MKIAIIFCLISLPALVRAEPLSIKCSYHVSVAANISSSFEVTTDLDENDEMAFSYVVEEGEDKGYFQGNNGASSVIAIWGDDKLSFVEVTTNGTVQVTAIYGKERGTSASVHSRSTGGKGYEMPSQYYGYCEIK